MNLKRGDEIKMNSALVSGKVKVEHECDLGTAAVNGKIK